MTEVLDRIEEELTAAARRRAAAPASARRRRRPAVLAVAAAGALLAGGGAVAAVTSGGSPAANRVLERELDLGAVPGGTRVSVTFGGPAGTWTAVAYEARAGWGVRGSEALCTAIVSEGRPLGLPATCQGPWPLAEGFGLIVAPAGLLGDSSGSPETAALTHLTAGLVPPDARRVELLLPYGTRRSVQLSASFTAALAGPAGRGPVPGAARDVPPPGGSVTARLAAAATGERPQAAVVTYADGRTERVPLR